MKNFRIYTYAPWLLALWWATTSLHTLAQQPLTSRQVEVTYNKTSSLVFPAIIKSVDRGSRDLLAQKAKGVENVLQLKAARPAFPETNLTVITADGTIHHFTVNYATQPDTLVVRLNTKDQPTIVFETTLTEEDFARHAETITSNRRSTWVKTDRNHRMKLSLAGIYIDEDILFCHFRIRNKSNIPYDVAYRRMFIKDRTKAKRTASQEVDLHPIHIYGTESRVPAASTERVVYAFEKFTIPDAKRLRLEMYEKNGGRNLHLSIRNRTLVKARRLTP